MCGENSVSAHSHRDAITRCFSSQGGSSGSSAAAVGQGKSWYPSAISTPTPAEYRVAALALVYHATSTGTEDALKELSSKIVHASSTYKSGGTWKPPSTSSTSERSIVDSMKEWVEVSTPKDHRGTISPVIHVAETTYHIFAPAHSAYNWRRRLCARIQSKTPTPLIAPSSYT